MRADGGAVGGDGEGLLQDQSNGDEAEGEGVAKRRREVDGGGGGRSSSSSSGVIEGRKGDGPHPASRSLPPTRGTLCRLPPSKPL